MSTGQDSAVDTRPAHIINGMAFRAGGVKLLIPLTIAVLMEEATGNEAHMIDFSHWKAGLSSGGVAASAFSLRLPNGDVPYTARQTRALTIPVLHEEFGGDANRMMIANTGHDAYHLAHGVDVPDARMSALTLGILGGLVRGRKPEAQTLTSLKKVFLYHALRTAAHVARDLSRRMATEKTPFEGVTTITVRGAVLAKPLSSIAVNIGRRHAAKVAHKRAVAEKIANVRHFYDHQILERGLNRSFGPTRVSEAFKSLFLIGYNGTDDRPQIFGSFRSALFPDATAHESSLQLLKMGEAADPDKISMYSNIPIAEALVAITSIRGIIGRFKHKHLKHETEDAGDHALSVLANIIDDVVARSETYVQDVKAKKPSVRKRLLIWGNRDDSLTPVIVPRLMILGVGSETSNMAKHESPGFISQIFGYTKIGEMAGQFPFLALLRSKYNGLSQRFTGRKAILEIDAPIKPDDNDPDKLLYPKTDIRDGSIDNIAKLTWFGAQRMFKNNAADLAEEMILSLRVLRDTGEWSVDKFARAEANIRKNLGTPAAVDALCAKAVLTKDEIKDILEAQPAVYGAEPLTRNVAAQPKQAIS